MQIKEGYRWKMAFTTPEQAFKLIVMFFGLTNFPAIFQTIINEIFWNSINTGKVVSFIDNIIAGAETEEGHDKIVEEVVKRLAENDLYGKLEKCKWKVRKVDFSRVVIEPEGIKIEKEKVKGVLDWQIITIGSLRTLQQ